MKKILIICAAAALTGCGIYKPYTRPEVTTDGLYGIGRDRRHDDPGRHPLAGNVHRSPVAGAYRACAGKQQPTCNRQAGA